MPSLHGRRGVGCRVHRVLRAVLPGLLAFFQQAGRGRLDAKAPVDRRHTPGEIRFRHVGPVFPMGGRRVIEAILIARPLPCSAMLGVPAHRQIDPLRFRDQPKGFQCAARNDPSWVCGLNCHDGKIRFILALEIGASGNARCAGSGRVGPRSFAQAPGEIRIRSVFWIFDRDPRLKIAGAGGEDQEGYKRKALDWRLARFRGTYCAGSELSGECAEGFRSEGLFLRVRGR